MGAISAVMKDCGHFFCAWHHWQNIIKQCGGSIGQVPYSALWVYNRLMECRSVDHFNKLCERYFPHMNSKDLQYLNNVDDASQYTVKQRGQGAFMFHCTMSQGSEVMNAVNKEMLTKIAVCPINACILLTNTVSRRYERQKKSAWVQTNYPTPHGDKEYKEVFDGVNYREFSIVVVECDESWECSVKRLNKTLAWKHTVSLPKEPTRGSYFGKCTCGLVTRDAIPCEHMAAVVCSSRIAGLNRRNIMPFWWTRKQWQEQFPQEVTSQCYANIEVVRADYKAEDFMRYCPSWSTPNKAGCPSKGKCKLSALEISQGKKRSRSH
jgi:hypothetical protein